MGGGGECEEASPRGLYGLFYIYDLQISVPAVRCEYCSEGISQDVAGLFRFWLHDSRSIHVNYRLVYPVPLLRLGEAHEAVDESVERVVLPNADVLPLPVFTPALADEDVPGDYRLTSRLLQTESFTRSRRLILRRATCLFGGHRPRPGEEEVGGGGQLT